MLQKYNKYDYRVQLMRILACFIVISCHLRVEPVSNGVLDKLFLLLYVFFDDGVSIFFMIMGFFLLNTQEPFWKSIGKTFIRILAPIFFFKLSIQLLNGWIINERSLSQCFLHPAFDIKSICKEFLTINFTGGNYSSHLWYIATYLSIVVAVPLLKLLALDLSLASKACRWLIAFNVTNMLITDLKVLPLFKDITISSFGIFNNIPIVFVVIGYMLYKNQKIFLKNLKYRILFIAGIIGIGILRFCLQCMFFNRGTENNYFDYWNTCISLLFSVCFVGFFLTFPQDAKSVCTKIVSYIGAKTYLIYIMHVAVYTFCDHRNIRAWLYSVTIGVANNMFTKAAYDLIYPIIIFAGCLVISLCLDCVKGLFRSICRLPSHRNLL